MTQKEAIELFEIIKNDDLQSFEQKVRKYKKLFNVCFGRFPILSVCYMYSSKKILKKFEKSLDEVYEYNKIYEPYQMYIDFKNKSGKSLRLYAGKDEIIPPVEMLAILGKDFKVKRKFNNLQKNKNLQEQNNTQKDISTLSKITKIYALKSQKVKYVDNKIKISPKPMSKRQKFIAMIASIIIFVVLGISGGITGIYINIHGTGSANNPLKIYNQSQLSQLYNKKNVYASFEKDFVITSPINLGNFSGTIYGNKKTLTFENSSPVNLFESFSGSASNFTINYKSINTTLNSSLSLFAKTNNGEIDNIKIYLNATVGFETATETLYLCGFSQLNSGTIKNSNILIESTISCDASIDCYFSGFVGINRGSLTNCFVEENSSVVAKNVSLAGFAVQNNPNCEISNCINNSSLTESSNLANLTQAVTGISIINYGVLTQCQNNGNLKIDDTRETTGTTTIYIGGICVENYTTISYCKNNANIEAFTQNKRIYAGGICAHVPNYNGPEISNCGTKGNINISKVSETSYVICGGIAGYMEGTINKCYSQTTFTNGYNKENLYFVGLAVGESAVRLMFSFSLQYYVNLSISTTYCMEAENVEKPLASNYEDYTAFAPDIYICSENEIINSSVYW